MIYLLLNDYISQLHFTCFKLMIQLGQIAVFIELRSLHSLLLSGHTEPSVLEVLNELLLHV